MKSFRGSGTQHIGEGQVTFTLVTSIYFILTKLPVGGNGSGETQSQYQADRQRQQGVPG